MDITWDMQTWLHCRCGVPSAHRVYNRCPRYVRLIWSCGSGIKVFLKSIAVSCSYKGVPMLHTHKQPCHAHSSQYLHCPEITTQSPTSAKLWTWSSPYDNLRKYFMALGFPCGASPTYSLDDATDGCVEWWHTSSPAGPQQVLSIKLLQQVPLSPWSKNALNVYIG